MGWQAGREAAPTFAVIRAAQDAYSSSGDVYRRGGVIINLYAIYADTGERGLAGLPVRRVILGEIEPLVCPGVHQTLCSSLGGGGQYSIDGDIARQPAIQRLPTCAAIR